MRNPFLFIAFIAAMSACGDNLESADAGGVYSCGTPWEIVLYNQNDIRSACYDNDGNACDKVGIAVPNGRDTTLVIGAVDEQKRPCDPSQLVASIDSDVFSLSNDGTNLVVTPSKDAFDAASGFEPSATLTVDYGELNAKWRIMSAVDLTGSWEITVDDLTVGDFEVAQSGRFIRWASCAPDDMSAECSSGLVMRETANLFSPLGSLKLKGWIWDTREKLNGVWTDGVNQGFWYAIKAGSQQLPPVVVGPN